MTALVDTIGGRGVASTASLSGAASGKGNTGVAVGWGAASIGLIALNAYSGGQSASALSKLGAYAESPVLYEIGSKTLPTSIYKDLGLEGMSQVEKGKVITKELFNGNVTKAFWKTYATPAYVTTIKTGLTPGATYALDWLTTGVNLFTAKAFK